ncbi:MAG: excinuclease ABC subunit UvrA [Bacteroidales bacterium]|nr:excinuclease ABC subunit UvrA [Bacteroidales bacterium]
MPNKKNIQIRGARVNNLKNVTVEIPRNRLVVITGLSGSGKSSLAFDTLYAEGQRRYVESLSAYARQFLGKMSKPEVDDISGISPAIAIEQKSANRNPRSTVGTSTEIYEYIKLLFARAGHTFSPISGKEVTRDSVSNVADEVTALPNDTKIMIFAPLLIKENRTEVEQLQVLQQMGFSRLGKFSKKGFEEIISIDDLSVMSSEAKRSRDIPKKQGDSSTSLGMTDYKLLVDRLTIKQDDSDLYSRVFDSIQTAYHEGNGTCFVQIIDGNMLEFSNRFELDGMTFEKPNESFFSFNNPYGACTTCEGYGSVIGISEDLVVPNPTLSVYEDAIAIWRGEKMGEAKRHLIANAERLKFPIHKPYNQLTTEQKKLLWDGNKYFEGIHDLFKWIETQTHKIQYRVMLARYRGKTLCPDCRGTRLRKDAGYVKVGGKNIQELVLMPIDELQTFFNKLKLPKDEAVIAKRILQEINSRLQFLMDVGLNYLTLNRLSNSLSGGEAQRINLATSLGSALVGSMYILDEPSIGLHSRDTERLIHVLKQLRDLGNSVIVVEHDEEIIRAADEIIDIGPLAGVHGGQVVFQGKITDCKQNRHVERSRDIPKKQGDPSTSLGMTSLTCEYLQGIRSIDTPTFRRKWTDYIELKGACEHNLQNLTVKFPLGILTLVTGVSGSGKTTLVKQTLYPALKKIFGGYGDTHGKYHKILGDYHRIADVEMVDQNPIGRSSRSNPATYVKAFDDIRSLFANQPLAKSRNYKPGFFSFNVEGGRCETCQGEGQIKVEMQFMADVYLVCEECHGTRFKEEVLEVKYHDKNISEILDMTVDEALEFFRHEVQPSFLRKQESPCYGIAGQARNDDINAPRIPHQTVKSTTENNIVAKLKPLQDVGLGYLKLGQSSNSLSGGEAQRVKLAYFLTKGVTDKPTLFIFDEPTTGLHFHDIHKLKESFDALIDKGHTIIVIEHHLDLIKCADHVIDIGPEGGIHGGHIVFEGTPEQLVKCKTSITGKFLKEKLL